MEDAGVGADRDDVDAAGRDGEVLDDLAAGGAGDGEHGRQAPGDTFLHAGEAVPAAHRPAALAVARGGEFDAAVDGDRVVHGGDEGQAEAGNAQQAVTERLVVVDDVERGAAGGEFAAGAQRERQGLGEAAGPHGGDLQDVDPVPVLPACGGAERVGLTVEVEAGQLGEGHALVEDGVGLGADHLDAVAEAGQFPGEVADVDALAAAERVSLVAEQCHPQRAILAGVSCHTRPLCCAYSRV